MPKPLLLGPFLRQLRLSRGLSQSELAERAAISQAAIAQLEGGRRQRPHPQTLHQLAQALRLNQSESESLLALGRRPTRESSAGPGVTFPAADRQPGTRPLPVPPTTLIGRDAEVRTAGELLLGSPPVRLLTLVGPGGVGKTRLALAVAEAVESAFSDGVAFVDLAPVHDERMIAATAAWSLGLEARPNYSAKQLVKTHLRERHMLLVFDNFEHLLRGAPQLAELLSSCPRLSVLATSRAALHLRAEQPVEVEPLAVPAEQHPSFERVVGSPAVQLFVDRARVVVSRFELATTNAEIVAAVCRRLDGLPLALELAAARLSLLGPQTLLERLQHPISVLGRGPVDLPDRQRTLRATLAWSHDLLNPQEQILFRRVAVFPGSWTLAAAEEVCSDDFLHRDDVVECLDGLVRNCLVQIVDKDSDARRFAMLETLREYAAEQLESTGEADAVRARHQDWCLALARQAQPELTGPHQQLWLDLLQANMDNMSTALSWALAAGGRRGARPQEFGAVDHSGGAPGPELGALQLATALWRFWWVRGFLDEGRRWMADALALNAAASAADRAAALFGAGMLAWSQADVAAARQLYEQSLELRRLAPERSDLAETLNALAITLHIQGDDARARAAYEESLMLYRELEDGWGSANALAGLAVMARDEARWQHALALYGESLQLRRAAGDKHAIAKSLHDIGLLHGRLGDLASARTTLTESLKLYHDIGRDSGIADCLGALSWVALRSGRASLAARSLGAAEALRASMGVPLPPADFAEHQQWEAEVRALVDQRELSETLAAALTRSREEIVHDVVADVVGLDAQRPLG